MAGALVGGAFLSALLQVLFDRMATPEIVDLLRGQKLTKNLLRKLEIALQSMNTVLEDAEEKQLTMPNVRTWLDGLKDAVYDAEDIVDDIFTKALRRELDAEFQIAANKKLTVEGFSALESLPEGMTNFGSCLHDLRIWRCSSLMSLPKDCPSFVSFPKGGLRAPNLTSFWVDNCKSLRSLPDKMHELLPSLQYLYIEDCPEVVSFPEGGLPLSLISIYIRGCDKLVTSRMGWGLKKLHSLRLLEISGKSEDVESFPEEELLPTTLPYLYISKFQNLRSLDKKGLQHLTSLKQLWICDCPKLKCMPEEGLPASLSILEVYDCPLLKKQWQKRKGKEWRKIAHVPCKLLDRELIN